MIAVTIWLLFSWLALALFLTLCVGFVTLLVLGHTFDMRWRLFWRCKWEEYRLDEYRGKDGVPYEALIVTDELVHAVGGSIHVCCLERYGTKKASRKFDAFLMWIPELHTDRRYVFWHWGGPGYKAKKAAMPA